MTSALDIHLKQTSDFVSDERILIDIIRSTIYQGNIPLMDPHIFESEYNLPSIPSKPFKTLYILKNLSGSSFTSKKLPEFIKLGQMEILFPRRLLLESNDISETPDAENDLEDIFPSKKEQELRNSLFYTLSRTIIGNIPNSLPFIHKAPGLDHFTHSLLSYHLIAQATNNTINWIEKSNTLQEITNPMWSILPLVPDASGLLAEDWNETLEKVRSAICIFRLPVLRDICEALAGVSSSQSLIHSAAADIWKDTTKTPRKKKRLVEHLITERFVLELPKLGLRYRVVM
ncbi:MAG: hypothetical protein ACTSV2_00690, partial [Candidatus Thorarchaeota archaeon]